MFILIFKGFCCIIDWHARTISTSEVPIPNAIAPNAPWVDVWESPHTIVSPGWVIPFSGPITWTIPFLLWPSPQKSIPCSIQFFSRVFTCIADSLSLIGRCWFIVGVLWSAVAKVLSGNITLRPLLLSPTNATGLVTSWIKCLSIKRTSGPSFIFSITCESQTLSNSVLAITNIFILKNFRKICVCYFFLFVSYF